MFCNQCGNKVPRGSRFCNSCGAQVIPPEDPEESSSPRRTASAPPPRPARRAPAQPARPERRRIVAPPPAYDPAYEEEAVEEYDDEEAYYEEENGDEEEEVIFRIGPSFYFVGVAYAAAVLLSVLLTSAAAKLGIPIVVALALSALFFLYPVRLHIDNKRIVYTLTTIKIEVEEGIFSQTARNIPLRHIQDVSISQPFSSRLIGVGDVRIDSEAAAGTIEMRHIDNPREYADLILDQLQYWK